MAAKFLASLIIIVAGINKRHTSLCGAYICSTGSFSNNSLRMAFILLRIISLSVLRCSTLMPPANGSLENITCGNVYGSTCHLMCNRGFQLKGSVNRKCDKKAGTNEVHWTGNETSCEGKSMSNVNFTSITFTHLCEQIQDGHQIL